GSARARRLHPLPLLDDVRVCLLGELAHLAQGLPAPVPELGDSVVNQLRYRLALGRTRLFHVLLLELPDSSKQPRMAMRVAGHLSSPDLIPKVSLALGHYTFFVRAFNAGGPDPTPAKKSFK